MANRYGIASIVPSRLSVFSMVATTVAAILGTQISSSSSIAAQNVTREAEQSNNVLTAQIHETNSRNEEGIDSEPLVDTKKVMEELMNSSEQSARNKVGTHYSPMMLFLIVIPLNILIYSVAIALAARINGHSKSQSK